MKPRILTLGPEPKSKRRTDTDTVTCTPAGIADTTTHAMKMWAKPLVRLCHAAQAMVSSDQLRYSQKKAFGECLSCRHRETQAQIRPSQLNYELSRRDAKAGLQQCLPAQMESVYIGARLGLIYMLGHAAVTTITQSIISNASNLVRFLLLALGKALLHLVTHPMAHDGVKIAVQLAVTVVVCNWGGLSHLIGLSHDDSLKNLAQRKVLFI